MKRTDLRDGDIVLLTTDADEPISAAVAEIDRSRHNGIDYSHAGLVELRNGEPWLLSATTARDARPSGVTALELKPLNRGLLVLRRPGSDGRGPLDEARRWVEPNHRNPDGTSADLSNFGVVQVVLSSLAAAARNLKPGSLGRRGLWNFAHGASRSITSREPAQPGGAIETWDCSAFVDHAFRAAGEPLGIHEGDPDPRVPREVWHAYIKLARGLLQGLCTDERHAQLAGLFDEPEFSDDALNEALGQTEGIDTASWVSPSDIREILRLIVCAIGRPTEDALELVSVDATPDGAQLVWPPFMSLRLMFKQLEEIGTIPASGL